MYHYIYRERDRETETERDGEGEGVVSMYTECNPSTKKVKSIAYSRP